MRATTISLLGMVAALSMSAVCAAAPQRAGSAARVESIVPAAVVALADVVAKTSVSDFRGDMKKKEKKEKKPRKSPLRLISTPEIDASAGSQAIALIVGVMLLGFERVRRSAAKN